MPLEDATQAQENALESALRLAASDPSQRPDFYKVLLESTVYILGQSDQAVNTGRIEAGGNISIQNWVKNDGSPIIPFFSSLPSLQRAIEQQLNYLALPAKSLFELTSGSSLVLNPKSPCSKEFFPNEIAALLASGVNHLPERRVTQQPTQVLLGQPTIYPAAMVDALTAFLSKRTGAKAAYLALMHDPSHDDKPHLVVGIDAEGDVEQIIREAGVVAADSSQGNEPVDLVRVVAGEKGLSEYFLESVQPFYERRWGGKLKAFLGMGRA